MSPSSTIHAYGIALTLPTGWDGAIYRRPAAPGETTHPVVHAASVALSPQRGDFGSGAVERLGPGDTFIALVENHPDSSGTALFAHQSLPGPLAMSDFSPRSLQRLLPGQAGVQRFFAVGSRAFCLYVVLGSYTNAPALIPPANQVVGALAIDPQGAPQ